MVKHTQTIRRLLTMHFVGLALKGLKRLTRDPTVFNTLVPGVHTYLKLQLKVADLFKVAHVVNLKLVFTD